MIKRTLEKTLLKAIQVKPVVLLIGARQVGKSTLCKNIVDKLKYNYVSLDNLRERELAISDPELFLKMHEYPLIIDEVQYAPKLFEVIEQIVNEAKFNGHNNKGMFILTGSQTFDLLEGVTQSMAGRVSIIEMSPLSVKEINNKEEKPFSIENSLKAKSNKNSINKLYERIIKGFYPELYDNEELTIDSFYSDYVKTYIERDISQLINLKDKLLFQKFMEIIASLTGQEFIANNIAKVLGVNVHTIQSWISLLITSNIIYLLEPYNERSAIKRAIKRPKLYFSDTGLAAYLAKVNNKDVLMHSIFAGRFVETYIINEIIKSHKNNNLKTSFYYYRDIDQNEIDLVMIENGIIHFVECKSGISYNKKDILSFNKLKKTSKCKVGSSCLICLTDTPYKLDDGVYAISINSI